MATNLNRQTTSEAVARHLRAEIQRGELAPGTRLRQSAVAARFGVSTTPVREAFALLQAQGLVRIDPHRGAIVFRPTAEDVTESYEIREVLEILAASLALPNLTDQDIRELQEIIDVMRKTENDNRWLELNGVFHLRLSEASGSSRLCNMIADLRDASSAYVHVYIAQPGARQQGDDEHQAIVDACRARDLKRVRKAVRTHLRHTVEGVVRVFDESADMQPKVGRE